MLRSHWSFGQERLFTASSEKLAESTPRVNTVPSVDDIPSANPSFDHAQCSDLEDTQLADSKNGLGVLTALGGFRLER